MEVYTNFGILPWDNACIESFHSIIKREWLNRFKIHDYKQAYRLIFEYLEAFYNTKRIHSHCNYMSPNEFERLYERTHTEAELLAS
ncbi:MAG: integrase core domain-containing protein [Roseburia sp.]